MYTIYFYKDGPICQFSTNSLEVAKKLAAALEQLGYWVVVV